MVGPDGEVTAVDLSAVMVAAARQRNNCAGVRYACGDITALDFPDATFDGVRSERAIQYAPDPDAAVAELIRVTAPGGRVCLIDTDWQSLLMDGMPASLGGVLQRVAADAGIVAKPTGRLLRGQLIRAGLTAVTAEPVAIPITAHDTLQLLTRP